MTAKHEALASCMIYVDKEGRWFHKRAPIIHRDLIAFFYKCLDVNEKGEYIIRFKEQECLLDVADTPFVVVRTDYISGSPNENKDRIVLRLIDDTREDLAPETLWIGADNVLYCKVREGKFKARFLRPSYYQLAAHIQHEPETNKYFICLNEKKHYIREETSCTSVKTSQGCQ